MYSLSLFLEYLHAENTCYFETECRGGYGCPGFSVITESGVLRLQSFGLVGVSVHRLIQGCPLLDELYLFFRSFKNSDGINDKTLVISSPMLKKTCTLRYGR